MHRHMESLIICALLAVILLGCDTTTAAVRARYSPLSSASTERNEDKFSASTFKNYFSYKTSLRSHFGLKYFQSYYYRYVSQYSSSTVDIFSSLLLPGENFTTFGNIFPDAYAKEDGEIVVKAYLIDEEIVISRSISLELTLRMHEPRPGHYRGTIGDPSILLAIKDRSGRTLFDISDKNSFLALEIVSVDRNIVYGKFSANLVGHKKEAYLNITEGEFLLKM